ncbi:MAG: molybdopterin-dependent oxidoreductase [Elusimicrobia bacterium]|nr:molybdopterin-dependent oxidoreductase [Elusimicrobiota bacterium]
MKITIDGRSIEAQGTKTVLEVAQDNGIYIPALCSHPRLAPYAACRLCVVSIKGKPGFQPSCNTYPAEGMEVVTDSEELRLQRVRTMELILSEHPNACLICSEKADCEDHKASIRKSAEVTGCVFCSSNRRCELQEIVVRLKVDSIPYSSVYRGFSVRRSDPFFIQDYNLCILCGRCVRICHEVRGAAAISFMFRGSQAVVGTMFDRSLMAAGCQFCGACVDVCPTGALAERVGRHEALPDAEAETVCPYCGVGCRLVVETLQGRIQAAKPAEGGVNRGQACVRGRFTLRDVVYSPSRIRRPMVKKDGKLVETSWEDALAFVAGKLKSYAGRACVVVSSQLGCEDLFVLDRFAREALGAGGAVPSLQPSILDGLGDLVKAHGLKTPHRASLADLPGSKAILVLGENVPVSHPVVWVEILEALRCGAKLLVASHKDDLLTRHASQSLKIRPGSEFYLLASLSKVLLESGSPQAGSGLKGLDGFKKSLEKLPASCLADTAGLQEEEVRRLAEALRCCGPIVLVFGQGLISMPWARENLAALWDLAVLTGARLLPLAEESDLFGAWLLARRKPSGAPSLETVLRAATTGEIKALYLAGPAPLPEKHGLEFLVVQDSFVNEACQGADAVLPAATFAEAEGHFVNLEGRVQKSEKVIEPVGEAKPDWWIASHLASRMGAEGFGYEDAGRIKEQLDKEGLLALQEEGEAGFVPVTAPSGGPERAAEYPMVLPGEYCPDYYRTLALCQASPDFKVLRNPRRLKIGPEDAAGAGLQDGAKARVESSSACAAGPGTARVKITGAS